MGIHYCSPQLYAPRCVHTPTLSEVHTHAHTLPQPASFSFTELPSDSRKASLCQVSIVLLMPRNLTCSSFSQLPPLSIPTTPDCKVSSAELPALLPALPWKSHHCSVIRGPLPEGSMKAGPVSCTSTVYGTIILMGAKFGSECVPVFTGTSWLKFTRIVCNNFSQGY